MLHLYKLRVIFTTTAELEPFYIMARNEEEAIAVFFIINARDIEEPCEITVEKSSDSDEANPA
jgi:hypothetical protein